MTRTFGSLTLNHAIEKNSTNNTLQPIDILFENPTSRLEKMTVIAAERQIAFENLKKLTTELQTKRLRYNAKSACKYFTL